MQRKQSSIKHFFEPLRQAENPAQAALPPCKKRERTTDTPALEKYFTRPEQKRAHVDAALHQRGEHETEAVVGITYRDDGEGKGAFFDHRTIQLAVDKPTAILNAEAMPKHFAKTIRENQNLLKFGIHLDQTHFKFPPLHQASDAEIGLILIPGVSKKEFTTAAYKIRKSEEMRIIQQALYRGQPVLGICGGCWTLYEHFGGTLNKAVGHNYRGGMPRLSTTNAIPIYNKELHRLELTGSHTLLRAALGNTDPNYQPAVNSVHFKVPNADNVPAALRVSAKALPDATLAPSNNKLSEKSIEAFETIHGVPVLGIQWHPEAYDKNTNHARMLRYMEQAGQRYLNHRQVLAEFTAKVVANDIALKPQNKFTTTLQCVRRIYRTHSLFFLRDGKAYSSQRHVDELKYEASCKEDYLRVKQNLR